MAMINPYLMFNGNCEAAFDFYKKVFGGEFSRINRFIDMPPMAGMEVPDSAKNLIMHVSLPVSKETILMGSDANPAMGNIQTGQNVGLSINTDSRSEADRIFNGLASGGKITLPIADAFWGAYFGMLVDKFGFDWMVSCEAK
jgi:PhnB protein